MMHAVNNLLLGDLTGVGLINEMTSQLIARNGVELMDAIRKSHPIITEKINFVTLIQYFNKYSIFTGSEIQVFNNAVLTNAEKANSLVEYLGQKTEEGIKNFVKALNDASEHSGHVDILQCILDCRVTTV